MRRLRSACRLLVKTIDKDMPRFMFSCCQLPMFTSNCQLPVSTSSCQLPVSTSNCQLPVFTSSCQLPVFTSNCQLPVFTSNCQLLMFMSNSCLQVVVAGDATFQDVKSEIARVYQGISSTSLDERYARSFCLISVMSGMLPYCKHE